MRVRTSSLGERGIVVCRTGRVAKPTFASPTHASTLHSLRGVQSVYNNVSALHHLFFGVAPDVKALERAKGFIELDRLERLADALNLASRQRDLIWVAAAPSRPDLDGEKDSSHDQRKEKVVTPGRWRSTEL
jgi:hypothetical protein